MISSMIGILRKLGFPALLGLLVSSAAFAAEYPRVKLETTVGDIVFTLDAEKAPKTVANFLDYVNSGYYDGMLFHRVVPGLLIQGGGYDAKMKRRPWKAAISNESKNGLHNVAGSIAMARAGDPNSATTEFFINLRDNPEFDYPSHDGWGYAVFGQVTDGFDTVGKIMRNPKGDPKKLVLINKAVLLSPATQNPLEESKQP